MFFQICCLPIPGELLWRSDLFHQHRYYQGHYPENLDLAALYPLSYILYTDKIERGKNTVGMGGGRG